MPQLDLGAQTNIPGKQTQQRRLSEFAGSAQEVNNTRADLRRRFFHHLVQPENVFGKESLKILRCVGNVVVTEKLAHQTHICAARKLQSLETIHRSELGFEDLCKSFDSGASGANKRGG